MANNLFYRYLSAFNSFYGVINALSMRSPKTKSLY